jgi:hypothetical protein
MRERVITRTRNGLGGRREGGLLVVGVMLGLKARQEGAAEGRGGVSGRWKGGWAVRGWDERRTKRGERFPGWIGPSKTSPEGLTEGFSTDEGAGSGSAGAGSGGAKAGG